MSSSHISGSELLLRKIPIYLRCKAQIKDANDEDALPGFAPEYGEQKSKQYRLRAGDEGNRLLSDASAYGILSLSRGIHEVLLPEGDKSSFLPDEKNEVETHPLHFLSSSEKGKLFRLADALSRPFDEIHVNMSFMSSSLESLGDEPDSEKRGQTSSLSLPNGAKYGNAAAVQQNKRALFDAALSMPVLVEAVFPSAASHLNTPHPYGPPPSSFLSFSRKRKRSDDTDALNGNFITEEDENFNEQVKICRYGSSLISSVYGEMRSKECWHILRAIRHPRQEMASYPGIHHLSLHSSSEEAGGIQCFRDAHNQGLEPLIKHVLSATTTSSSSHSSARQERDDQATVQAYLKRFLWIINQIRQKPEESLMYDPSSVCWEDMTEGERVKSEMKHIIQQRARFSRTRSA